MQSTPSKTSEQTRKIIGPDYEFEVRVVPLPEHKRAEWDAAMEILLEMLEEVLKEQQTEREGKT